MSSYNSFVFAIKHSHLNKTYIDFMLPYDIDVRNRESHIYKSMTS